MLLRSCDWPDYQTLISVPLDFSEASSFLAADVAPMERSSLNSIVTWWNPNSTLPIRAYELLNLTAHPSNPEVLSGHPLGTQTYADPTVACAYNPDCYLAISFDLLQKNLFTYNYFGFWLANEFITTVTWVQKWASSCCEQYIVILHDRNSIPSALKKAAQTRLHSS